MGAELDVQDSAALAAMEDAEKSLAAKKDADLKDEPVQLPRLGLIGGLTKGKKFLDGNDGDFYNNVTGEVFGTEVEFLVVDYFRGRFYSDEILGSFRATSAIVPAHWPERFRGKAFVDLPETEEGLNALIDGDETGKTKWGHGPPISTTYNFVGFVLSPEPETDFPVELSLMRANVPAARAIRRLLTPMRNYHDRSIRLSSESREAPGRKGGEYYVVEAGRFGTTTSPENRARAVDLAMRLQQSGYVSVGDETEPAAPATPGGPEPSSEEDPDKPDF